MAFSDLFFILEIMYPRKERTSYGLLQNIARHLVPCLIRLAMFIYRFTLLAFELNYCSAIKPAIKQAYNLILYFYPLSAQFRFYRRGGGERAIKETGSPPKYWQFLSAECVYIQSPCSSSCSLHTYCTSIFSLQRWCELDEVIIKQIPKL